MPISIDIKEIAIFKRAMREERAEFNKVLEEKDRQRDAAIRSLLKEDNMPVERIASLFGMTVEEVQALRD